MWLILTGPSIVGYLVSPRYLREDWLMTPSAIQYPVIFHRRYHRPHMPPLTWSDGTDGRIRPGICKLHPTRSLVRREAFRTA